MHQTISLTCHNSCVVLTGLKGTLALPRLHLHPSILCFLQGEGGELLKDDRKREVRTTKGETELSNELW